MRWSVLVGLMFAVIIIPFILFEKQFEALGAWLASGHASGWTSASIIAGLLALDVFLPVPSSVVSTVAGVLFGFWRGMAVIWVGMIFGCVIGYAFGARAAGAARKVVGADGLVKAGRVMERHGSWALVICRPIPVLAESSIVFAGLVRSPLAPFIWLTTLSNLGIAIAYAAVGAFSMKTESFLWTFVGALALPGIAMLLGRLFVTKRLTTNA
jgi:uncharacterized membrane protein YdjX (TVP38/TMEM64 family)